MHYGKSLISAPRLTDHHRRMHGDHGEIATPNQTNATPGTTYIRSAP